MRMPDPVSPAECVEEYGARQVQVWRRAYDVRPPAMAATHPYHQVIRQQEALRQTSNQCLMI